MGPLAKSMLQIQDFPPLQKKIIKSNAGLLKLRVIPDLLSDDREGKRIENIDFKWSSNRASFMGNPVLTIRGWVGAL